MELVKQRKAGTSGLDPESATFAADAELASRIAKGKMKQQDFAGCIRADRQNLRLAELELLFKVIGWPSDSIYCLV